MNNKYVKKASNIKYDIHDGDKTVKLNAILNLINHGNKTIDFQVDLKPSEQVIKDTFKKSFDINVTDSGIQPRFIILKKESEKSGWRIQGEGTGP
ncbi:MAG: DUF4829 domain-containing protein [Clostridiales bacterium]|jgi:hypothetical protein|nr:DUF4829 domain-containing protein [Eubacteriales bacterium]MDH7567209.1 DUF4829 domain-containing protein [Clostridiales bacterium]